MHRNALRGVVLLLSFAALAPAVRADADALPQPFLDALAPRPLGPGNMSGRVTAVAVVESRPATMYVAAASGGVWKTVNNGVSWTPVFDDQPVASIGDVAVAPSNPNVVWVGTGEANARNSVCLRRRRLQIHRRRQDLEEHGPARLRAHRPRRHPSA